MAGTLTGGPGTHSVLRVSTGAVAISVVSVLPMFLTAGLAVQIGADLDISPSALGAAPATFFGVMVISSPLAGRLVRRVGAVRAVRAVVVLVGVVLALTALTATSLALLLIYLSVAGLANGLAQPAINQLVARLVPAGRQGAAYGAKYSAIPVASMLAGLSVPLLGLTVGWRWAFGAFALAAVAAAIWPFDRPTEARAQVPEPNSGLRLPQPILLVLTTGVGFAAAGGSALAIFMVPSAVATGWDEAHAGILFATASAVGICGRLLSGFRADRRGRNHLWVVMLMLVAGAAGVAGLVSADPALFAVGACIAFGAGWGWPGLFILAVVRLNPTAPAAATGLTQTGTSAGCVVGPLIFGVLAEGFSYGIAWAVNALMLLTAAGVILVGRRQVRSYLSTVPVQPHPGRHLHLSKEKQAVKNRELVESYFAACNEGVAGAIAGHFHPDAVVYDLNHGPLRGADAIGDFYVRVRDRWQGARWEVNTYVGGEDTAAVEWTLRGSSGEAPFTLRGSEHYQLRDGLISQIRQYWSFDRANPGVALQGYPYTTDSRFGPHDERADHAV